MPKGAQTIAELAHAVDLLQTRDRNRQKELKAVRGLAEAAHCKIVEMDAHRFGGDGIALVGKSGPEMIDFPTLDRFVVLPKPSLFSRFFDWWVRR